MKATKTTFPTLVGIKPEGLVFFGCGGNLDEWITGISDLLFKEKIASTSNPDELWAEVYEVETTGGRIDLVFVFKDNTKFNMGKMVIFRLKAQASWLSDYVINYAEQHGCPVPDVSVEEEENPALG